MILTALLALASPAFAAGPEIFDARDLRAEVQQESRREYERRVRAHGRQWVTAPTEACQSGVTGFKSTVHALFRTRCTHCHDVNADIKQGPPFAVADPAESYSRVSRLVNWDDYVHSYLVTKGGNRHCVGYGYDCATGAPEIQAALEAWWKGGEADCPRLGRFFTARLPLPANLPVGKDAWVPMRFDLSDIDPALDGAVFEIEVQQFAAPNDPSPGAYRFRKPRVASVLNHVHVKGIRVLVNGKFDSFADAYVPLELTVGAAPIPADSRKPLPHPVLSADPLIVTQDKASGDVISIAFEELKAVAQLPACKALASYQKNVLPTLRARNCFYCHSGGDQNLPGDDSHGALSRLSFAGNDAALCARLLQRVTPWNAQISPLISYPLKGSYEHPRIIPSVSEVSPGWLDWMAAELSP
jgi:hypothetical protein